MKKLYPIKSLFLFFLLVLVGFKANSQLKGEHYVYDHDTIIVTPDSNIYVVENLGENVNSSHVESGPRISPDGKTLYFFRINHPKNVAKTRDIWESTYVEEDSSWTEAKHMGSPLNCHGANGVHWISPDGNTMLLHNTYLKNGTMGNGVSITHKEKKGWSKPQALKIHGYDNHSVCSFIMSDNMNVLIMCIKQKGTYGEQDLFISKKVGKNTYSKPVNMGPILNTPQTEATAWLNHTGDTLYFSSNGHPKSLGGMDIYRSVRTDTTVWDQWSKPVNMGAPYNTTDDEYYFSIPDKGDYIYMAHHFSSSRDSSAHSDIVRIRLKERPFLMVTGRLFDDRTKEPIAGTVTFKIKKNGKVVVSDQTEGGDDEYNAKLAGLEVYSYEGKDLNNDYIPKQGTLDLSQLKEGVQKRTVDIYLKRKAGLLLSGNIFDDSTKEKLDGVVEITFAGTDKVYKTVNASAVNGYEVFLDPGNNYDIKYSANPYLPKIINMDLRNLKEYKEQEMDIYLQLLDGASFELKNIFFDYNRTTLKPASFIELDRLVKIMKDFPNILVEIGGHTDSDGSDLYNENLSQGRAQSVVDYLVKKGIPKKQFEAKGYGEKSPVVPNNTDENKAKNRRVEFKVLKIK